MLLGRDKVFGFTSKDNSRTADYVCTNGLKAWTSLGTEIRKPIPNIFCLPGQQSRVTGRFSTKLVEIKNPFLYNGRVTAMTISDKSSSQPYVQVMEMIL